MSIEVLISIRLKRWIRTSFSISILKYIRGARINSRARARVKGFSQFLKAIPSFPRITLNEIRAYFH